MGGVPKKPTETAPAASTASTSSTPKAKAKAWDVSAFSLRPWGTNNSLPSISIFHEAGAPPAKKEAAAPPAKKTWDVPVFAPAVAMNCVSFSYGHYALMRDEAVLTFCLHA